MEEYNYDALSSTIKFEDITSSETNQDILRRLKENDIDELFICNEETTDGNKDDYTPLNNEDDMGWLGYFIGNSTNLKEFHFLTNDIDNPEALCRGMTNNKSIKNIGFHNVRLEGNIFGMMDPFFKNNHKLTEIDIEECELGTEDVRQLSLTLGSCNKSLKHICVDNSEIGDGQMVDIILALSMHPQLEKLVLTDMNVGRNECRALATLLRDTTKHLQTLNLGINNIHDEGVEALVNGISGSQLQVLDISCNLDITIRGWKTVSTLLEMPDSNLVNVNISHNNLGDEEALIFANALRNNHKLKHLCMTNCGFTTEGWMPFSKLLCDTSSVNNTYCSNHTLLDLGLSGCFGWVVPADVRSYLDLNGSSEDKGQVAMTKILQHHSHFKVQAFFEWEFKVLTLIINWLENAADCTTEFDEQIRKMKLSCMYDFVREFPMLYVEPVTRKEIEKYSAMEMKMEGDPMQQAELKDIQKCKARAMRRLF